MIIQGIKDVMVFFRFCGITLKLGVIGLNFAGGSHNVNKLLRLYVLN